MLKRSYMAVALAILGLGLVSTSAQATLVADGITYNLIESTTGNPLTDQFMLNISGINGASDTEKGRYGVQSFAFTQPSNYASASPPAGFTEMDGGLSNGSANGCNGSGNFFCFYTTPPSGPALAPDSSLSYIFSVTLSSGDFANYGPDFKINWVGTKNNYDLVSRELDPTPGETVPEPGSVLIFGTGLLLVGLALRRRYRHEG